MSAKSIFKMFGRSPIRPLQEHMAKVHTCATKLEPFFAAVVENDWKTAEKLQHHIAKLEHEADNLKRSLRLNLSTGMFMAISRADVLELVSRQDYIANRAKDIAGIVIGRRMSIPQPAQKKFLEFVQRSIDASAQANKAIHELDELLEAGFSGNEVEVVEKMIDKLLKIERETDVLERELRQILFSFEKELPPVDVMFFYKVIEWIGELANRAQHIGDRLQILIAG